MKPPFKNQNLNYLYYTSLSPRELAKQERMEKEALKKKKRLMNPKNKLTPREKKLQDILFFGRVITKKIKESYKNFI